MKMQRVKWLVISMLILGVYFLSATLWSEKKDSGPLDKKPWAAPVETAAIERGPMALGRTFSGTLESNAEFLVAPKVSGRVEHLAVDMGDPVFRKQEVARLDNDEYVQAVAQAQRDLLISQIAEVRAVIHYRIALFRLFLAEGSLLHRRGVVLQHQNQFMSK